jgi:exonuclease SbcD
MITFYHTADIHFGVENYGKIDSQTGIHTRLLDFKKSLSLCIDNAIKDNVDFFLFSGDAYKTAHPTPTQQKLLMEELFKLQRAQIPIVIVVGNHDHPLSFGKANALDVFADLPLDGFIVFSKPDLIVLQTKNGPVQIVGIPWPTRNNVVAKEEHRHKNNDDITSYLSSRVIELINHFASQVDPNIPAILASHLTVSNGIFSGSEKRAVLGNDPLFLPSDLALPVFDYVGLGHLHRYQNLNPHSYPAVVYSGSIDRVDFGERKEEKGYCKVTIQTDVQPQSALNQYTTLASHEFVKIKTRPFIQIECELKEGSDQTEQVLSAIKHCDLENAIVKLLYHVPDGMNDKVNLAQVEQACSKAHYLVGIIPVRKQTARSARVDINVDMEFTSLIKTYLDSRSDLKERRTELLSKALCLHDELAQGSQEE